MWEKDLKTAARRFLELEATYGRLAADQLAAPPRPTARRGEWRVTPPVWETDVSHLTQLKLLTREPAPIYKHELAGEDCEHDAPEWQAGPADARITAFHKYASGTRERFLVEFTATGHTYALQGKEVEDALKKATLDQLPEQRTRRRAPVPTATSQRNPIAPEQHLKELSPEVGRRGRAKLKAGDSRAKTFDFEVIGAEVLPDNVIDDEWEGRIHCRTLLRQGQRHNFVLTSAQMDAAAAAYGQSETQRKVARLERERQRRYNFLHATAARPPPTPLTPTEREVKWEESRIWLRNLPVDPDSFYGSGGFVVGQGFVPKTAALAYGRVVAEASKLFVGTPGSDTYTDGVKLFCLRDALIFGTVQEGLPYGAEIKRRCLLFLDGGLKELYDTVLVRRTAKQPQSYSAVDCEQLLRDEVTRRRKGGDVRGMVDVMERSLDPPPCSLDRPCCEVQFSSFQAGRSCRLEQPRVPRTPTPAR